MTNEQIMQLFTNALTSFEMQLYYKIKTHKLGMRNDYLSQLDALEGLTIELNAILEKELK
jgi:hypothetical protein